MKTKTLVAMAALALLVALPARAEQVVVSSNTVGYTKVTVPAGMTIVGQQFVAVGGGANDIQSIKGEGFADAGTDALLIWNGSAYEEYLYFSESDDINGNGTAAWGNYDWEAVEAPIAPGTGMWINTQGDATVTFAGEVDFDTLEVSFEPGMNLISQTLPMDVNIQDVQAEGLADAGTDAMMVWNGTEYTEYLYFSASDDINGNGTAAWGNYDWEPVEATLPAGHGFWLSTQGSGTLTFPAVQ